jgi:hypothetical protein
VPIFVDRGAPIQDTFANKASFGSHPYDFLHVQFAQKAADPKIPARPRSPLKNAVLARTDLLTRIRKDLAAPL